MSSGRYKDPNADASLGQCLTLLYETGVDVTELGLTMGQAGQLLDWVTADREAAVRNELIRQGGKVVSELPPADEVQVSHSMRRTVLRLPRDIDWPPKGARLIAEQVPEGMLIRIVRMDSSSGDATPTDSDLHT